MTILIKGMEMPDRCANCPFMDGEDSWCTAIPFKALDGVYKYGIKDKPSWCPLVPIPPHGRLIDADAADEYAYDELEVSYSYLSPREASRNMQLLYRNMPTIIEAEE